MQKLAGKVALITGAARGQGRSHAIRLAEAGAAIIAMDICAPVEGISYGMATPSDLAETERLVQATGASIMIAQVDIRDSQTFCAALDRAVGDLGGLDIVVANAGVAAISRSETFTQQQWNATISVNLTGTRNTMRFSLPHLTERGGGSIVAIASVAGVAGLPFFDPNVASKLGIIELVRTLSIELGELKVRVNALCPTAVVETGMQNVLDKSSLSAASEKLRLAFGNAFQSDTIEASVVSNAVLYLASDDARLVTGAVLPVEVGSSV